jgi:hypothetical protein
MQKRVVLNQTGSHTQPTENTDFQAIAERCMAISRERNDNVIPFHEERIYGADRKPEPEKMSQLQYSGMPKLFWGCTFESYQGNEQLVTDLIAIAGSDDHVVIRGNPGRVQRSHGQQDSDSFVVKTCHQGRNRRCDRGTEEAGTGDSR